MKKSSYEIDLIINSLEGQMTENEKHVMNTESIRSRFLSLHPIDSDGEIGIDLQNAGLTQAIQARLQTRGYRSLGRGMFVNVGRCANISYLRNILASAEATAEIKAEVVAQLARLVKALDGQSEMEIRDGQIIGVKETMTQEEFWRAVSLDSV